MVRTAILAVRNLKLIKMNKLIRMTDLILSDDWDGLVESLATYDIKLTPTAQKQLGWI